MNANKLSILFVFLTGLLVFSSCDTETERKEKELMEKHHCTSVDDCLSQYNFEGARALQANFDKDEIFEEIASSDEYASIIAAESTYLKNLRQFLKLSV